MASFVNFASQQLPNIYINEPQDSECLIYSSSHGYWTNSSVPYLSSVSTSGSGGIFSSGTGTVADPLTFSAIAVSGAVQGDGTSGAPLTIVYPTTTKGDLFGHDASQPARVPVGPDDSVLAADSAQGLGVGYKTLAGDNTSIQGNGISSPFSVIWPSTTKGDLIGFGTSAARLPVGTNGQILTPASSQSLGIKWGPVGDGTTITTTAPASVITSGLPSYHGDGTTISTNTPFSSLQHGDGTTISTNAPFSIITGGLPTYAGDGTTISTASPFSVLNPVKNYMWVTAQVLGSSPSASISLPGTSTWTTVPFQPLPPSVARVSTTNFNATNNSFIAPEAGHYILSASVIFYNGTTNCHFQFGFHDITNGRTPDVAYYGNYYNNVFGNGKACATVTTGPVYLEQNREINVQAWQDSGSSLALYGLSFSAIQLN